MSHERVLAMPPKIAVILPCYRVRSQILGVLSAIGPECDAIYVVDDACPEQSGAWVCAHSADPRVRVLRHEKNQGVGAAVMTGYRAALAEGFEILVKMDGDGQMDPRRIHDLIEPIVTGHADYAKGNRFFRPEFTRGMPLLRLLGNAALSFLSKFSTGYWHVFDPTNGYTALHANVARLVPFDDVSHRYFFESDLLHHLNLLGAVVADVPMEAIYKGEPSSLLVHRVAPEFLAKHAKNLARRIFYNYLLRDFNIASVELLLAIPLLVFGGTMGSIWWRSSVATGIPATAGTVMLAALPVLLGTQLFLSFWNYDASRVPRTPLHPRLNQALVPKRRHLGLAS